MSAFRWTDAAVREALELSGTRVLPTREGGSGPGAYTGISTDSRTVRPGELYVALVGDRFDGHDFVGEALVSGALGAVVSREVDLPPETRLYRVEDTLVALGELARHRREALDAPVVAITGSSGKTTTKDLLVGALKTTYRVHATPANLNNRIGLPRTLLDTPDDAQVVVLEAGTNEPGEIGALGHIARPDIAVVTTVGASHLEKLGSVQGVLEEKLDLFRAALPGGRTVVGDEPAELVEAARILDREVRVAGWSDRADEELRPQGVEVDHWGVHRFSWNGASVALALPGRHAVSNALLALATAELLGVSPRAAARGIGGVEASGMRGEHRRIGGLTVLVDCYNANPQSVRAALDLLEAHEAGRKVAVLGTMLELGEREAELHRTTLHDALRRSLDLVVATGAFAPAAAGLEVPDTAELPPRPDAPELLTAADWSEAYPGLRARLRGDETLLLKASRGMAMEGMLPWLERDFAATRAGEDG